jgi:hypothetical protein
MVAVEHQDEGCVATLARSATLRSAILYNRLRSCEAVKLRICEAVKLRICEAVKLRICEAVKLRFVNL